MFKQAVLETTSRTENNALAVSNKAVGDPLLVLSTFVRGQEELEDDTRAYLDQMTTPEDLIYLILLMFYTRDPRHGKGEKSMAYQMLAVLAERYPTLVCDYLLPLLPAHGCWKDLWSVLVALKEEGIQQKCQSRAIDLFAVGILGGNKFAAKWSPREKKRHKNVIVRAIAASMYPEQSKNVQLRLYRQRCASLCKELHVPEQFMCAQNWAGIDPKRIPSVCLNKNNEAFLNLKKGQERSTSEDRRQCRENILTYAKSGAVNGALVDPARLAKAVLSNSFDSSQIALFNAQFESICETVTARVRELGTTNASIGNMIPIADVSGSMMGKPLESAIGLSLLIASVNSPEFRDLILTFSHRPQWHDVSACTTFSEKVQSLQNADWGMNTNLLATHALVVDMIKKHNIPNEQIPSLVCFSDMEFDEAVSTSGSNLKTTADQLEEMYSAIGRRPPLMYFWNLRASTATMPCKSDHEGVVMMGGCSASMMKMVLSGQFEAQAQEDVLTPAIALRMTLSDVVYDDVREVLALPEVAKLIQQYF